MPESSRRSLHLTVGRLLFDDSSGDGGVADDKLFEVVSHLNLGRVLITEPSERLSLARLNLGAGRRAKSSTAYQAALGYLQAGIELLSEEAWESEYEPAFELHREAAEAEYLCGRFEDAEQRFALLLAHAREALDKAQVYDLRLLQYESLSRYAEAAQIGLEGLLLFGLTFPEDEEGRRAVLEAEVAAIEELLAGRPIGSLVDLPVLDDPEIRMVLRLLTDVWASSYISGDDLLPALASARIVSLSIHHGNTEDSAYGYVTHAINVGSLFGQYAAAYDWGRLALSLNDRFGDQKRRAKIHQQFNAHVTLWRRPLATCIPHAREACRSGLQTGDFAYAGYGAFTESWAAFLVGRDLERFVRDFTPTLALLRRIRTTGLADAHGVMLGWALALQGLTENPLSLSHEGFDETAFAAAYADNPFFLTVFHVAKLHLAVNFGDRGAALAAARSARALGPWGRGTIWPVLLELWGALAIGLAPTSRDGDEPAARETLLAAKESVAVLARSCPENFRCWALLLEAEGERLAGRPEAAWALYEDAIRFARDTDSLQNEALANELCGRLWHEHGREKVAAVYLGEARRSHLEWGALAKVRQLDEQHPGLALVSRETGGSSLDVGSVTKAAQVLAGEIVLEELLRKLMQIVLENAGAQRGFFLQEKEGALFIEAEGHVGDETTRVLSSQPLESSVGLCRAVVQYVRKTGARLVIGDAATDERFSSDPYVLDAKPKSILCVPVAHQAAIDGILYLENNLTTEAFTSDRVLVLDVLASQAAISLANARLYREKSEEVERRKLAEEDLRGALAEVETLKNRLQAENVYLQEEIRQEHNFEEIVGSSAPMLDLLEKIERVAPTDATVLLQGETGTGKELLARALHSHSERRDRPLTKVNCGAIPAGLVESELFGHVKGAFTGALERRIGRFELADGGTIFLDEVGELPPETQVKLLRVLQERELEPVGSSKTVRVNVRVVAATNRDLQEEVRLGRFRADLFYRLSVFPLRVPPLRERPDDVPKLVTYFLGRCARRFARPIDSVSRETMNRLARYSWPGNVRELQNIIERAVILSRGPELVLGDDLLPLARPEPVPIELTARGDGAPLSLKEKEKQHILRVLEQTSGVIEGQSGAARILDIHPNTLRSRMKRLGIR